MPKNPRILELEGTPMAIQSNPLPSRKQKRKCVVNDLIMRDFPFIRRGERSHSAFCSLCEVTFTVASGGRTSVSEHVASKKHKRSVILESTRRRVSEYFKNIAPGESEDSALESTHVSAAMMPAATVMPDTTPLYDPRLLQELDWSQNTVTFSPAISPVEPGSGLVLRPLCLDDINKGFLKVLGQLTETGNVNPEQFLKTFEHMKSSGDYYVTVVEDTVLGEIVATATLVMEHKFTHSCAKRGRVEDVVVSGECRGKQLGKLLMTTLTLLSKRLNCYKITLECQPKNVAFYEKFGYSVSEENYMYQRFFN